MAKENNGLLFEDIKITKTGEIYLPTEIVNKLKAKIGDRLFFWEREDIMYIFHYMDEDLGFSERKVYADLQENNKIIIPQSLLYYWGLINGGFIAIEEINNKIAIMSSSYYRIIKMSKILNEDD
jgi:bifunctional DNA-binding transcriptional regulator/antitoxin component of YhaV-PrlF toxin-antitoxin module